LEPRVCPRSDDRDVCGNAEASQLRARSRRSDAGGVLKPGVQHGKSSGRAVAQAAAGRTRHGQHVPKPWMSDRLTSHGDRSSRRWTRRLRQPWRGVDGRSLVPLLRGQSVPHWRTTALIEHRGPDTIPGDPDRPGVGSGNPPSYKALLTASFTYVEYADGTREYYDRITDPDELDNSVNRLPAATLAALHKTVRALAACHGLNACWEAAH
jgi:hypothetical protein